MQVYPPSIALLPCLPHDCVLRGPGHCPAGSLQLRLAQSPPLLRAGWGPGPWQAWGHSTASRTSDHPQEALCSQSLYFQRLHTPSWAAMQTAMQALPQITQGSQYILMTAVVLKVQPVLQP